MGSVGKSNISESMSFRDAEMMWTTDFPNKSDPRYEAMRAALSKEVENPNSDYTGVAYRGIDITDLKSEAEIRERFKVGTIIKNDNNRDFQSWAWNVNGAEDFAHWGSELTDSRGEAIHVILRSKNGIQGSRKLPNTDESMYEVLTRGSNKYRVTGIKTEVQDPYHSNYGAKVYYIDVEQINNKRRKK